MQSPPIENSDIPKPNVQSVSPERAQVVTLSAIAAAVVSAGRSDFRSIFTLSFVSFDLFLACR